MTNYQKTIINNHHYNFFTTSPSQTQKIIEKELKEQKIEFNSGFYKITTQYITINTLTHEITSNTTNQMILTLQNEKNEELIDYLEIIPSIHKSEAYASTHKKEVA